MSITSKDGKYRAVLTDDIRSGRDFAPYCVAAVPVVCQFCGESAVLPLDEATLAKQPDDTTHVCHPALNGCNQGFSNLPLKDAREGQE